MPTRLRLARWTSATATATWLAAAPMAALEPDVAPEAAPPEPIPEESFHPEPEPSDAEDAAAPAHYVVRAGDTLSGIAARELGSLQRWREIARINDLDRPEQLRVGQKLSLPQPE